MLLIAFSPIIFFHIFAMLSFSFSPPPPPLFIFEFSVFADCRCCHYFSSLFFAFTPPPPSLTALLPRFADFDAMLR
jgi:hypothetical protein